VLRAGVATVAVEIGSGRWGRAESAFPEFSAAACWTFSEKERSGRCRAERRSFSKLLAADTLKVAEDTAQPQGVGAAEEIDACCWARGVVVRGGVLVWMIAARPGFLGYGASLLWTGPRKDVAPLYQIRVMPGDGRGAAATVMRWCRHRSSVSIRPR